jgi:opacity protein-like surface antigen
MRLQSKATRAGLAAAAAVCALAAPAAADGFNGPYIGIGGYLGWGNVDARIERVSFPTATGTLLQRGPAVSGAAGYDWEIGRQTVVGLATDIGLARFSAKAEFKVASLGAEIGVVSTMRGRVGHLIGKNSMIYATGGVAFLRSDLSGKLGTYDYNLTGWVPGWVVGGGFETRASFANVPVRIGLEALYMDYNLRHIEVPLRHATLDYSGWSLGARLAYEFNRSSPAAQPMK